LFESVFEDIEKKYECSSICGEQQTIPFKEVPNFYTFSNINNGWPKLTCQAPMYTELKTMINFYFMRVASVASFLGCVLVFFSILLLCRVKKVCCRKGAKKDAKKRASNGMVVGADGLDDEDIDPNSKDRKAM